MNSGRCQISEWSGAPQMDTGAPMPGIALHDRALYVSYIVRDSEHVGGESYAVVRFSGVSQHTFGYPNDEALAGHPLFSAGLSFYAFNEVANSPYLQELAARNARTHPGSEPRLLKRKHWIVSFHDETLEVVGDAVEFMGTVVARSASEAIEKLHGAIDD